MIVLFAVAVLQLPAWVVSPVYVTVGDTVRLVRRVSAAPDVQARLRPLNATPALEPLSQPRAAYAEGDLTIVGSVNGTDIDAYSATDAEVLINN